MAAPTSLQEAATAWNTNEVPPRVTCIALPAGDVLVTLTAHGTTTVYQFTQSAESDHV